MKTKKTKKPTKKKSLSAMVPVPVFFPPVAPPPEPTALTVWGTADGRKIPILAMEDYHLTNAVKYLLRRGATTENPYLREMVDELGRRKLAP